MKPFTVYLLHCADDSYYVGHTDDLAVRLRQHQEGEEGYTATRRPLVLAWTGEFETRDGAADFEQQLKGWSREKKEALMRGDVQAIQVSARNSEVRGFRQAQPERPSTVRPELVEGFQRFRPEPPIPVRTGPPTSVRPEPVQGLLRLRSQAASSETGLRQAQPEREGGQSVRPEPAEGPTDPLLLAILSQDPAPRRRAIAKTITLLESTRADHRLRAEALLNALLPHTGRSLRLGISGVPGVGKSTFIEALGLYLIGLGHRVAVLAVDPSSSVSGGSILGDKTRMEQLSVNDAAYIRPSPSSGTLGGVAERTREAMLVCEAAGYDIVIVETVGVGQSETAVAGMTDMFVLLQLPNAGDDLQAIKKGVMEIADLVVINKADLDEAAATRARAQISSAQRLFHGHGMAHPVPGAPAQWQPTVIQLSALKAQGMDSFWQAVQRFQTLRAASGQIAARRQQQDEAWMWERLEAGLKARFRAHPGVREQLAPLTAAVRAGELAASVAARRLLDLLDAR